MDVIKEHIVVDIFVFSTNIHSLGACTPCRLTYQLFTKAQWYILNNCTEIGSYLRYVSILSFIFFFIIFILWNWFLIAKYLTIYLFFTLLIREHCKIFSRESPLNVDSKHEVTFTLWFKDRVSNVFLVNILFF